MKPTILLLLCCTLWGCGSSSESARFGECPTRAEDWPYKCTDQVAEGTTCTEPEPNDAGTDLPSSCYCESNGFWVCNSCPFFWTPVAPGLGECTPGTTCNVNSWEHGCSCGCGTDAQWHCSPDTINSRCPGAGTDAGV